MVICAGLDTNIRKLLLSPINKIHGIIEGNGDGVIIKNNFGRDHLLDITNGELWLKNIQLEYPIVSAIVDIYQFKEGNFYPKIIPRKGEYNFPTLFELERLSEEPIIIKGILHLDSDGINFQQNSPYYLSQKSELEKFLLDYMKAFEKSYLKKPVIEGFYKVIKEKNDNLIQKSKDSKQSETYRRVMKDNIYQKTDLLLAFGEELYKRLKDVFDKDLEIFKK